MLSRAAKSKPATTRSVVGTIRIAADHFVDNFARATAQIQIVV
jgi:hypothetical protein